MKRLLLNCILFMFGFLCFVLIMSFIFADLNRESGYLMMLFDLLFSWAKELRDISDTPLGSLTITKIFFLIWSGFVVFGVLFFGFLIYHSISNASQDSENHCY